MTADDFASLFDEHADAVFGFCFRRTADHALADDLTATVFLEAWRRRDQVDLTDRPALPWLFGVANNVLRNARRSMRRHREALERIPRPPATRDVEEQARMRELLEAVAALPRHEREVVELVAWADLSYADAAAALDVPVGTVRSRLSRARARLGAELLPVPQEVL